MPHRVRALEIRGSRCPSVPVGSNQFPGSGQVLAMSLSRMAGRSEGVSLLAHMEADRGGGEKEKRESGKEKQNKKGAR